MKPISRQDDTAVAGTSARSGEWRDALLRAIETEIVSFRKNGHRHPLVRQVRLPYAPAVVIDWLRAQERDCAFYWSDRGAGTVSAGIGIAHEVFVPEGAPYAAVRRALRPILDQAAAGVRYVGGMRFDPSGSSPDWKAFGAARFVLPRFCLEQAGGRTELVCNLVFPNDVGALPALRQAVASLAEPAPAAEVLPTPIGRHDAPERDGWGDAIRRSLAQFEAGTLEKIVMARQTRFSFSETLDALLLLQRLEAATPHCFHFFVQFEPGRAFLGASPERLYRREGRRIESEAVAGTRPRGASSAQDAALKAELMESEKDRREQAYVQTSIREGLTGLCTSLTVDAEPRLMELAKGRHLCSQIRGVLRARVGDIDILERLHPTPAVGGFPAKRAIDSIRDAEPFDRGWYAGPVGWMGRDSAEFAVAIRSGAVTPTSLALYAGAGIVLGSEADKEWAEIEHKISDFLNVLGLDLRDVK